MMLELLASSFQGEDVRLPSWPRLPRQSGPRGRLPHAGLGHPADLAVTLLGGFTAYASGRKPVSTIIFDMEHRKKSELGHDPGAQEQLPSEWCGDCSSHFCLVTLDMR